MESSVNSKDLIQKMLRSPSPLLNSGSPLPSQRCCPPMLLALQPKKKLSSHDQLLSSQRCIKCHTTILESFPAKQKKQDLQYGWQKKGLKHHTSNPKKHTNCACTKQKNLKYEHLMTAKIDPKTNICEHHLIKTHDLLNKAVQPH